MAFDGPSWLTARVVYGVGLWVFLATIGMTLASIIIPEWITWDTGMSGHKHIHYTYGLHQRCSSVDQTCIPFDQWSDCQGPDRTFCSMWRTVGFLMSFSVVVELATLVAFLVLIIGGKQRQSKGWPVLIVLLLLCAAAQVAAMSLADHVFTFDSRFFPGWKLDRSFVLCTVSWAIQVITTAGILGAVYVLPEENGYELLMEREARRVR